MKGRSRGIVWLVMLVVLHAVPAVGQSAPRITNLAVLASGAALIEAQAVPGADCTLQSTEDLDTVFTNVSSVQAAGGNGAVAWTVSSNTAPCAFYRMRQSTNKVLITWEILEAGLAGTFAVPMAEEGEYRFGYSHAVHAQLTNGNLLVEGHPYYCKQAEVQLPPILDGREGTRVGDWIDITGALVPDGWDSGEPTNLVGGMLEIDSRIHFTKYQWYNGSGTDWQTQGYYEGPYDGSGMATGLWTVNNSYAHHSRVGGYMSYPPQALQDAGYVYLAGLEGISGAALGRWGPNLFAVNPSPSSGAVPAATLICHDSEPHEAPDVAASNATSAWWIANSPTNEQWWIANKATGAEWIETDTHHGVVFFVYRGLGETWYGLPDEDPGNHGADPYGGTSGFHAEGWALQVWIYDPADLMAVYRSERDPWSLAPAEAVLLTERLPGSATENYYSFFTGKARTELKMSLLDKRLIILQEDGYPANEDENTPKGYVISLP